MSTDVNNLIYYDQNCPGISEQGIELVKNTQVTSNFSSYIFEDYQTKYINTHKELEKFNKKDDFELLITINNNKFYKYIGNYESPYITMHKESLNLLKNYNL